MIIYKIIFIVEYVLYNSEMSLVSRQTGFMK